MPWDITPIPQPLYKYRQWNEPGSQFQYQKRILTHNELYFPTANQFNDPFDASLPFKFKEEQMTDDNIFKKLCETYSERFPKASVNEVHEMSFKQQTSGWFENGRYWKEQHEAVKENINKNFGIFSMTCKCDNLLMWSHYANSHKGFCVGFDKYSLVNLVQSQIDKVQYENSFPYMDMFATGADDFTKLLTTKSLEWEYEDEYRIIKTGAAKKVFTFQDNAVLEVILGHNMPEIEKDEIFELVTKKFPKAKLYQSDISKEEFKLLMWPLYNFLK